MEFLVISKTRFCHWISQCVSTYLERLAPSPCVSMKTIPTFLLQRVVNVEVNLAVTTDVWIYQHQGSQSQWLGVPGSRALRHRTLSDESQTHLPCMMKSACPNPPGAPPLGVDKQLWEELSHLLIQSIHSIRLWILSQKMTSIPRTFFLLEKKESAQKYQN